MSNSQRRAIWRNRPSAKPRFTADNLALDLKLRELDAMRRRVLDQDQREERANRAIPTSGPWRRRRKAERNQLAHDLPGLIADYEGDPDAQRQLLQRGAALGAFATDSRWSAKLALLTSPFPEGDPA